MSYEQPLLFVDGEEDPAVHLIQGRRKGRQLLSDNVADGSQLPDGLDLASCQAEPNIS
ncbi:hypothetical protein IMZ48_10905 [Candidatus Bathyarchaeota archaeon]|nr:hypothetical protein [Candidatus Bathyarchaeota archaeon]